MVQTQPHRKCLGTGESLPKRELLRFVKGPDNQVWFDLSGKADGRGAYTRPNRTALQRAMQKRGLSKYLNAQVPEDLEDRVTVQLTKQALQALGLAKKAGALVIGLEEVLKAQRSQFLVGVVLASDAGSHAQKKIELFQQPKCTFLEKEQLEKLTSVPNTSVVGLTDSKIWHTLHRAQAFIED
ncbi:MAG: DUF448 domain-containing protein [Alphaproteobacteria bacterium]|nr:DUF448 domain-containing protein [Alphaproteobacteria bacterium]MDD9920121.1 DUF448 domain-containing protein [Alphaproteobacteria bacterium]